MLVYNGDMADAYEGGATPFDTGGLHAHRIHYRSVPGESGAAYCKRHSQPLATWRSSADAFVREHFEWPTDYVLGKPPIRDDQSGDC